MTFLHTIFLSALAAAAIPLLLHLLSRHRLPLVKFSTLEFLKRLQKRKSRRVQLKQIILLIIRTLAVAAVVLVFARPAMQVSQAGASAASVEMVVIVDDGISAHAETVDGSLWRRIGERVNSLAEMVNESDRMTILLGSSPRNMQSFLPGQQLLVQDYLEYRLPSYEALDLDDAMTIADSIFAASSRFNRELYIVSGFYEDSFDSLEIELQTENVKKLFLPVGPEGLDNVSIDSIHVKGTILQENAPIELAVMVHNHGSEAVDDVLVSAYLDHERVAQSTVDIGAGSVTSASIRLTPRRAGQIGGYIKIENFDPLEIDNRRYFVLDIPAELKVFAVAADTLTRILLQAAVGRDMTGHIKLDWQSSRNWEAATFSGYDLILLAGVKTISPGVAMRIADYVRNGKGIIYFPGMETDIASMSRGLWKQLGFNGAEGSLESINIGWGKYDLDHPIFRGVFEKGGKPESPHFSFGINYILARGDQVIIPFTNGKPFLIERVVGEGRALMFASPFLPEAGNLVFSGIAAPLMVRSINYASSPVENNMLSWRTGEPARVIVSSMDNSPARLIAPDERETTLPPRPVLNGVGYKIKKLELPGIYTLITESGINTLLAANLPAGASSLNRRPLDQIDDAIIIDAAEDQVATAVAGIRFGREIWLPLAFVFLMLLLSESIIGRSGGRE